MPGNFFGNMLYAVIKRFDSHREITDSMFPGARMIELL